MRPDGDAGGDPAWVPGWPRYVRVLAVCHVLTYPLQAVAFFGLALQSAFLFGFGCPLDDGLVLGLRVAAVVVFILCWAYRRWFVWWGRRNYPAGRPE